METDNNNEATIRLSEMTAGEKAYHPDSGEIVELRSGGLFCGKGRDRYLEYVCDDSEWNGGPLPVLIMDSYEGKITYVRDAFSPERGRYPAYYEYGQAWVYDSIAGHYTDWHSLTPRQIARVKRLANRDRAASATTQEIENE